MDRHILHGGRLLNQEDESRSLVEAHFDESTEPGADGRVSDVEDEEAEVEARQERKDELPHRQQQLSLTRFPSSVYLPK